MFLESMSMLLNTIENIELVSTAFNGQDVFRKLEQFEADIVLCDFHMPIMGGIEVLMQMRQDFPDVKVLILTMSDTVSDIRAAIQAGAQGYLLKTANKTELENAIHAVYSGKSYFNNSMMQNLAKIDDIAVVNEKSLTLSARELDVLKLIAEEKSSTQIAEQLFISINTVETHRKSIFRKLNVHSSLGLLKYALKHGMID
jgi:DNA-binding NarL/FixJ family response regulator